jgi:protein-S-isoprenylcysteine O-methyltransferase Ste14
MTILKHIRAVLVLPVMVTIVVPVALVCVAGSMGVGWSLSMPFNLILVGVGILVICLGIVLMVATISMFARIGQGTLAPWDPTERLVVQGIYRYVRNPMISGVFMVLLGEGMVLGSVSVVFWFLVFVLLNLVYIPLVEERELRERFGDEYEEYQRHVPRWVPRMRAWAGKSRVREG